MTNVFLETAKKAANFFADYYKDYTEKGEELFAMNRSGIMVPLHVFRNANIFYFQEVYNGFNSVDIYLEFFATSLQIVPRSFFNGYNENEWTDGIQAVMRHLSFVPWDKTTINKFIYGQIPMTNIDIFRYGGNILYNLLAMQVYGKQLQKCV
jgi:hypothetical protein